MSFVTWKQATVTYESRKVCLRSWRETGHVLFSRYRPLLARHLVEPIALPAPEIYRTEQVEVKETNLTLENERKNSRKPATLVDTSIRTCKTIA